MSQQHGPTESTDPGNKSPEQIEAEVEATRARVSSTLDTVQDRMAPGPLFDELVAFARERGGGDLARSLARDVQRNPLPLLLIGAGLAWLAIDRGRPRRTVVRERPVVPPLDGYGDDPYLRDRSAERFEANRASSSDKAVGAITTSAPPSATTTASKSPVRSLEADSGKTPTKPRTSGM